MITFLYGDNSYDLAQYLQKIVAKSNASVERVDGSMIDTKLLPDLLMGTTLFAAHRLIIIKGLSENKQVWPEFDQWVDKVSSDTHVVLVDTKPDKRTKTFKALQKMATIQEFKIWGDRDAGMAERWVVEQASARGFMLSRDDARLLVERVGLDQWSLAGALDKLSVIDVINADVIKDIIDANPVENVFNLFEAALKGQRETVAAMIRTLAQTDDPFMVFGLLSGQVFQLFALSLAQKSSAEVAKDIGAHPFALQKLSPHAIRIGTNGSKGIVAVFAKTDTSMKSTGHDPWMLIEQALMKTSVLASR